MTDVAYVLLTVVVFAAVAVVARRAGDRGAIPVRSVSTAQPVPPITAEGRDS
jgi:hypothetical protein